MGRLFLGKWWHWLLMLVVSGLLWQAGQWKSHVIHFNSFIMVLLVGTVALLLVLIMSTKPGEQVTRDKLEANEQE